MSEGFGEDTGSQGLENVETYQPEESQQQVNDNPAWKDILEPVPEEFHGHLRDHLSKTDKYVQEVQQKYAPYKSFEEQGLTRDQLEQSIQLANLFQTNPRGIAEYLNNAYNFFPTTQQGQQSQGQKQTNDDEFELGEKPNFDISQDPRFQQVQNQAQLAAQAVQQMQDMQLQQQVSQRVQTEVQQVTTQFPDIDRDLLIQTALGRAAAKGPNVEANLTEAAEYLRSMGIGNRSSRPAPPNLSGRSSAGLPADSQPDPAKMSRAQRNAYVADLMRNASEGY
jgi:hypothetical protein